MEKEMRATFSENSKEKSQKRLAAYEKAFREKIKDHENEKEQSDKMAE